MAHNIILSFICSYKCNRCQIQQHPFNSTWTHAKKHITLNLMPSYNFSGFWLPIFTLVIQNKIICFLLKVLFLVVLGLLPLNLVCVLFLLLFSRSFSYLLSCVEKSTVVLAANLTEISYPSVVGEILLVYDIKNTLNISCDEVFVTSWNHNSSNADIAVVTVRFHSFIIIIVMIIIMIIVVIIINVLL